MKVKIIAVGKLKEKYLKDGIAEYRKRMSRFTKFEMIELPDEQTPDKASEAQNQQIMEKEGDRILAKLRSEEHTSELQSRFDLVCRLLLEKKNQTINK